MAPHPLGRHRRTSARGEQGGGRGGAQWGGCLRYFDRRRSMARRGRRPSQSAGLAWRHWSEHDRGGEGPEGPVGRGAAIGTGRGGRGLEGPAARAVTLPAIGTGRRNGEAGADGATTCSSHPASPGFRRKPLPLAGNGREGDIARATDSACVVDQMREGLPPVRAWLLSWRAALRWRGGSTGNT